MGMPMDEVTAHPRLRGEHAMSLSNSAMRFGSSPPARGALDEGERVIFRGGLIPACAGSTLSPRSTALRPQAHPRLRGEHRSGSWGYVRDTVLIPACAGSTRSIPILLNPFCAHPRLRGEHKHTPSGAAVTNCSSPPARGALVGAIVYPGCPGAHPRLRGEHRVAEERSRNGRCSSPPARGAPSLSSRNITGLHTSDSTPVVSGRSTFVVVAVPGSIQFADQLEQICSCGS